MNSRDFKRICRNRNFYIAQVYVLEEEIKKLERDFCTPRAPRLEVIGAPAHDNQSHIVDYITHKIRLEKERDGYLELVRTIDSIRKLPKPWCDIYWKSLVEGAPVRTICKQYDISKDMYYRRIYTFLNRKRG